MERDLATTFEPRPHWLLRKGCRTLLRFVCVGRREPRRALSPVERGTAWKAGDRRDVFSRERSVCSRIFSNFQTPEPWFSFPHGSHPRFVSASAWGGRLGAARELMFFCCSGASCRTVWHGLLRPEPCPMQRVQQGSRPSGPWRRQGLSVRGEAEQMPWRSSPFRRPDEAGTEARAVGRAGRRRHKEPRPRACTCRPNRGNYMRA